MHPLSVSVSLGTAADHVPPPDSSIQRGDDDGSFTFTVTLPDAPGKPIEVTAMIPGIKLFQLSPFNSQKAPADSLCVCVSFPLPLSPLELSDYPSEHQCYLYTTSEGVSAAVSDAISSISAHGMKVPAIITTTAGVICKTAAKRGIKRQHSADGDPDAMEVDGDFGFDGDDDGDDDDGDAGGFDSDAEGSIGGWSDHSALSQNDIEIGDSQVAGSTDPLASEYLKEFCADLRAVKSAGYKVGVLGNLPGGSGYVAVSIRISKLGISDEAMTAWRLNPEKYLVVLMHYPAGYKPLSAMAKDTYNAKRWVQTYVGTSSRYKPSLQEAITAFTKVKKFKEDQDGNIHVFKAETGKLDVHGLSDTQADPSASTFEGTFISRPISELLNERLLALSMYRVSYGFGWDGAEMFYEGTAHPYCAHESSQSFKYLSLFSFFLSFFPFFSFIPKRKRTIANPPY